MRPFSKGWVHFETLLYMQVYNLRWLHVRKTRMFLCLLVISGSNLSSDFSLFIPHKSGVCLSSIGIYNKFCEWFCVSLLNTSSTKVERRMMMLREFCFPKLVMQEKVHVPVCSMVSCLQFHRLVFTNMEVIWDSEILSGYFPGNFLLPCCTWQNLLDYVLFVLHLAEIIQIF